MKNPISKNILFLRVKNQDHQAYGEFYDLYVDKIYRFVFFKINSVEDAKDLTSEVFLKVWQYIKDGKSVKNLNAFIYMVARNSVIDYYRLKSKKEENEEFISSDHILISEDDLLLKQIKNAEIKELFKALSKLKDEYREVVILYYLDELSAREIGKIINKTSGAVRVILHRAINALKSSIK